MVFYIEKGTRLNQWTVLLDQNAAHESDAEWRNMYNDTAEYMYIV